MSYRRSNDGSGLEVEPSTAGATRPGDHGQREELLLAIQDSMAQVTEHAHSLAGYVLELEKLGVPMPAMRPVIEMLWEAMRADVISAQ